MTKRTIYPETKNRTFLQILGNTGGQDRKSQFRIDRRAIYSIICWIECTRLKLCIEHLYVGINIFFKNGEVNKRIHSKLCR